MSGQGEERARRLERERALYRYTSALERADLDGLAAVLHEAETDEALERMILEVNDVYRAEAAVAEAAGAEAAGAELVGAVEPVREGGRVARRIDRWVASIRRRGGMAMKGSGETRGRTVAPAWIASGVVAVLVVVCLGGWVLFSALGRGATSYELADSSAEDGATRPGLAYLAADVDEEARGEGSAGSPAAAPMAPMADAYSSNAQVPAVPGLERLIIRTGTITVQVEDTLAAQQAVESLVARLAAEGAYVVSSQQYIGQEGEDPYITMSIRVPAARFGEAMNTIAGLAVEVVDRSENANDVTEEYVDLEGRLEALEAARDRLLEIMSEAQRTEDLLQAEQQLTQREAEIESIRGRMQYLSQSAALSAITIYLQPDVLAQPVSTTWRPAETVRRALEALLDAGQGLVDFAIFFGIAILPWLLVVALVVYLVYRFVRWTARRRRARAMAGETELDK